MADFLGTDDGANLLTRFRRAGNILWAEEKNDGVEHTEAPDAGRSVHAEEMALHAALQVDESFEQAMATLLAPIDAFFEKVTVNADEAELRVNRLRLLARVRAEMNRVADVARVEG